YPKLGSTAERYSADARCLTDCVAVSHAIVSESSGKLRIDHTRPVLFLLSGPICPARLNKWRFDRYGEFCHAAICPLASGLSLHSREHSWRLPRTACSRRGVRRRLGHGCHCSCWAAFSSR